MKRKYYAPLLTSVCLLLLLASPGPGQDPLISIHKIEIEPGMHVAGSYALEKPRAKEKEKPPAKAK